MYGLVNATLLGGLEFVHLVYSPKNAPEGSTATVIAVFPHRHKILARYMRDLLNAEQVKVEK